ncbi:MAG TPA: InlB B-repeat-containing protein, partial [Candidatus Dojkabacteria bacterium]|nr:InlB B-repeat-containing protein [Candidatus Dojkabacteria bacterium]
TNYTLTAGTCGGTFTASTGVCSSVTTPITVTANWTINTYDVLFNANGGSCTNQYNINYGVASAAASCSRLGHTISSYTLTAGSCGGTFSTSTGICSSMTQDLTVQANWTINTFSVAYALNPTTGGAYTAPTTRPQTINYGSPTPTATVSTNAGYTWNTFSQSGCGGTFTASTGVCSSVTAAMTITANWNINVTINANSGTCTNDDHTRTPGAASLAPGCTRTGYTLTNYTLTAGTCGGTFTAATGVCSSVTAPITVTANWLADTFQVTVDATGGSCNPGTHNVNNGSASSAQSCTRTGYTLAGFTQTGCGGTFNTSTGVCSSVTQAMSITASWTAINYNVSYTKNISAAGTINTTNPSPVPYGTPSPTVSYDTNTGYTFVNFSITSGICGGTFTASTGVCSSVTGDLTIQANWSIHVSYTENIGAAGSLSPTYRDVGYGASATGPTVTTNTGYVFVNFSITSGSCAGTFTPSTGTCSNVQVPITIQANWNIRVSYTENIGAAGSLSPTYRDVAYGASATGPTVSTNTGYTFVNFSITSGSCAGTFTASTGTCDNVQAPITIQANWILNTYQVTVDPSGGSCSPGTHSVNHGSASSSQSCSRTGYTLSGFTQSGCGGTFNTTTGVCSSVTQAMSITANWTLNTYQVTVNANGGSCDPGTHTVDHGNQSLAQTCSRGGYTFSGFTQSGCGGSFNTSTGECSSVTSAMTITATWSNIAPAFSATPYEAVASYSTSPTSIGSSITFRATATDANANYYLIICSTNSVTPGASGAAPSCGSTKYCNSSSTASGSQASCSYTTNSGDAWSNAWYAFVCDNNSADPKCSSANQGSGDSGSPFYVNHPPTFSDISITDSSQNPTESVQWNATASDPDGNTVKLLVCKTNAMSSGSCTGGAWCTSSLSTSNPSCSYTIPTPTPDGSYDAWVYVVDQFNLGASGTGTKQGSESDFTVNNVAPVVSSVALNSGNAILLNENTTTQIQLSATVTDANGCGSEIPSVLGYVYRSGISFTGCDTLAEANQNYCYPEITCSENSGTCSGSTDSSAVYNCNVAFNYYADPTDNGTEYPEQNWLASVTATDNNGATQRTELSTGVELNSLPACEATPNIDYGSLNIEMIISPLSIISTISSTGNVGLNHNISGSNMCTNYPACTWGTPIAVTRQRYSLNSSTIYPSGTILTSTPTFIATKLPKQRTSTKETVDIWWGISIPTGIIAGDYNGEVFLTPIKSDVADW